MTYDGFGMSSSDIRDLANREYQAGFVTDIESETIAPGLSRGQPGNYRREVWESGSGAASQSSASPGGGPAAE